MEHKKIMYLFAGVLLVASCWFYFAGRNDVSDIGKRADSTRYELRRAGEEQREQAGSLDRAEEAVRNSADRAGRIEENERRDAEIIRECKSIIGRVRERGPAQGTGEG